MKKLLEICVDSLASARAAIRGGADRLELCSALAIGGLTPYSELLRQIRDESDIAVRCLMRPRGGDFLYTTEEIRMLAAQINTLSKAGADGFVIGCLTPDGMLDENAMRPLVEAAEGKGLTLHRCIDVSAAPLDCYFAAKELSIDTVLTSGARSSAIKGIDIIAKLLECRDKSDGPEVLIGAGINAAVIEKFLEMLPAARAFHMSGKGEIESGMRFRRTGVPMGIPGFDEWHISQTSEQAVLAARKVLDK